MISRRKLLELVEEGENLTTEFKLRFSTPDKIAKELIAFANTRGGLLLIGVADDKRIIGVASEKEEAGLVEEALRLIEPEIEATFSYQQFEGKEIVIVSVAESPLKPHRIQDYKPFDINTAQVYVRVQDKSVQASKEMIKIMKAKQSAEGLKKYSVGVLEKQIFSFLNEQEAITVQQCATLFNVSNRRASRSLVNLVRAGLLILHTRVNGEDFFTSAV